MKHRVYVIQEVRPTSNAPVKIGVALNVQRRLEALQIGNPRELVVVMEFGPMTSKAAYELENFYHRQFKPHQIRGEWFHARVLKLLASPARKPRERTKARWRGWETEACHK